MKHAGGTKQDQQKVKSKMAKALNNDEKNILDLLKIGDVIHEKVRVDIDKIMRNRPQSVAEMREQYHYVIDEIFDFMEARENKT